MRLYDSLTREVEEVRPVEPGRVKIYACGPTVYRYAHLGNLRTYLLSDLIRRVLELEGVEVTFVQNVTDVGHMTDEASDEAVDKMQLAVEDEGLTPLEIARKYTEAVLDDARAVGIRVPDVMPKATDHISEMLELTQVLIDKGHAYPVEGGSVYYDVTSFPDYGRLSGNTLDKLKSGHRDLETDPRKRHLADFALWKAAGAGRLMKWDSPWGEGFPGWHIECSAMSMRYLGDRFDIHVGGTDLRFPHHEDEIAQSEGAVGHQVVSIWVHGGHLRQSGQKISKSTGNVVRVPDLVERGIDPLSFRLLTFQTRYRSEMDLSWDALETADHRVRQLRRRIADWPAPDPDLSPAAVASDERFRAALGDDLDMPTAVKVLNELVSSPDVGDANKHQLLGVWDGVLGLDLRRDVGLDRSLAPATLELVRQRDEARESGDYERADRLRDELVAAGFEVMDTAEGTRVRPGAGSADPA